ncbi:MAG: NADH-quinone oxidoreductase subunit M, partial [Silvanigrellaceae bacterium]|nr:NADH-quinone oxidoreductase subunit M [Silvanigrellaceae bacterium]
FAAITLAFAIKAPLFPFHTWLMDTYAQAPAVYTVVSGIILKLATYAVLRFSIILFPEQAQYFGNSIVLLGVIGILYGALIAWRQSNLRLMMAYSSLSHIGFILVGLFSLNMIGISGALYQMVNHAVTAGALFILISYLERTWGTTDINSFGGLAKVMPWFTFFLVVACMGAVALPGTGSFIGEWLVLIGLFKTYKVFAIIAALGVILGAVYMLWMVYKVVWGPFTFPPHLLHMKDIGKIEFLQLSFLTVMIFGLGFAFTPLMKHTQITLSQVQFTIESKKPYDTLFTNYTDNGEIRILRAVENVHTR